MSRIRAQKLKIRSLVQESDLARVEAAIRTEPLVTRTRQAANVAQLAKTLAHRFTPGGPRRPWFAMAVTFTLSLTLPLLAKRSGSR